MTKDEFYKLFKKIQNNEFNINKVIPIVFINDNEIYGDLKMNYDLYINKVNFICFTFSEKLLNKSYSKIKDVIKHELIHYSIMINWKNDTRGVYNILFPHGYYFIRECLKHKVSCLYYILTLGLSQFQFSLLKQIKINFK